MRCKYTYVDNSRIPISISYELDNSDNSKILEELKNFILKDEVQTEYEIPIYCEDLGNYIEVEVDTLDYIDEELKSELIEELKGIKNGKAM